jgi:hypothetical protein
MKRTKLKTLLQKSNDFSKVREADLIINYLKDPSAKTELNATMRKKLDLYTAVYNLRLNFKQNSHIVGVLTTIHKRSEKQARIDIAETEYIFGKVLKIDIPFEKAMLLEASKRNVELALLTKDNNKISKAIEVHQKLVGEEPDISELPDFSKFEPHTYNMVMSPQMIEYIMSLLAKGAVNLSKEMPSREVQRVLSNVEDAQEVTDAD